MAQVARALPEGARQVDLCPEFRADQGAGESLVCVEGTVDGLVESPSFERQISAAWPPVSELAEVAGPDWARVESRLPGDALAPACACDAHRSHAPPVEAA